MPVEDLLLVRGPGGSSRTKPLDAVVVLIGHVERAPVLRRGQLGGRDEGADLRSFAADASQVPEGLSSRSTRLLPVSLTIEPVARYVEATRPVEVPGWRIDRVGGPALDSKHASTVGNEKRSGAVHRHGGRCVERGPDRNEGPRSLMHRVSACGCCRYPRHTRRRWCATVTARGELNWPRALPARPAVRRQPGACGREHLDPVIVLVGDPDVSAGGSKATPRGKLNWPSVRSRRGEVCARDDLPHCAEIGAGPDELLDPVRPRVRDDRGFRIGRRQARLAADKSRASAAGSSPDGVRRCRWR